MFGISDRPKLIGQSQPKHSSPASPFASFRPGLHLDAVPEGVWRKAFAQAEKTDPKIPFPIYLEAVARDEKGNRFALDTYSKVFVATLLVAEEEKMHVAHVSPPGLGKSTIARHYLLWRIGFDNQLRTVVISGDESSSTDAVSLCRQIVLTDSFKAIFPNAIPDYDRVTKEDQIRGVRGWAKSSWFLQCVGQRKDPTMSAVAMIPHREDMRVDLLLADDIVTETIAASATESAKATRTFFNTWIEGRLSNSGARCIYLQNLRRKDDLAHIVRKDARFISLWVGVNPECDSMFVRIWNAPDRLVSLLDRIAALTRVDASSGATAEWQFPLPIRGENWTQAGLLARNPNALRQLYKLVADSPDDMMFSSWASRKVLDGNAASVAGLQPDMLGFPTDKPIVRFQSLQVSAGLDLSSQGRDGCVLVILARLTDGTVMPLYTSRGKWNVARIVEELNAVWNMGLRWSILNVENNGVQDQIIEAIKLIGKDRACPWVYTVVPFATGRNKVDPTLGLPGIDVALQTGGIVWPGGESINGMRKREWLRLESEFQDCPKYMQSGQTPDGVMAFWFAWRGLDRAGTEAGSGQIPTGVSGAERTKRLVF